VIAYELQSLQLTLKRFCTGYCSDSWLKPRGEPSVNVVDAKAARSVLSTLEGAACSFVMVVRREALYKIDRS
jgi:hypothetical protein